MLGSDVRSQTSSVRLSPDLKTSRWDVSWSGLTLILSWLESRPAFLFILLSFAFGSAISVVVPPLRGPDEVAHFLRIHSYARGELLPAVEVGGAQGNTHRTRAPCPARVLQECRGTLRPTSGAGPSVRADIAGAPRAARHIR